VTDTESHLPDRCDGDGTLNGGTMVCPKCYGKGCYPSTITPEPAPESREQEQVTRHEPTGIVTVPKYLGDAISQLCDTTRELEVARIVGWMQERAKHYPGDYGHALNDAAAGIAMGAHHEH
jgi:hypothetical protein